MKDISMYGSTGIIDESIYWRVFWHSQWSKGEYYDCIQVRLAKNHGKKSTKEGLTGLGYQITVPNGMHVKHDAGLYAMLEHNDFCKMMMMTCGIPLGDNGWLLKLCQIFFPKYLELVWQQFVKVVPKIFYFSICQIYEFVGCQQRSTTCPQSSLPNSPNHPSLINNNQCKRVAQTTIN